MRSPSDLYEEGGLDKRTRIKIHTGRELEYAYYGAIDPPPLHGHYGKFEVRLWATKGTPGQRYIDHTKHLGLFDTFEEAKQAVINAYVLGMTGNDLPHVDWKDAL